jgi:hypothetical protein
LGKLTILWIIVSLTGCLFPKTNVERPQSRRPAANELLEITTLNQGQFSQVHVASQEAIVDEVRWREVWKMVNAHQLTPYPLPEIDFTLNSVLAVFMGNMPTGGYSVFVRMAYVVENQVMVHTDYIRPAHHCLVPQVLTAPFHLVKIPVPNAQVLFEKEQLEASCSE